MSTVTISKFNGGLNTQYDVDELPLSACVSTSNFEIDKNGMLYKRTPSNKTKTGLTGNFVVVRKWVSGDGNAYWIVYDDESEKIIRYDSDWTNATNLSSAMSGLADVQMYDFGGEIRFANGKSFSPSIYQYIDRRYFWANDTLSGAPKIIQAHHYDTVTPRNDVFSFSYTSTTGAGNGGSLKASTTYSYKLVAVFDGVQEAPLPEDYVSVTTESGANDKYLTLQFKINHSSWNGRVTAIKVYRTSDAVNYYYVFTVSTLNFNDPDLKYVSDGIVNVDTRIACDNIGELDVTGMKVLVNDAYYIISSKDDEVLTLSSGLAGDLNKEYVNICTEADVAYKDSNITVDNWDQTLNLAGTPDAFSHNTDYAYPAFGANGTAVVSDVSGDFQMGKEFDTELSASTTYYMSCMVKTTSLTENLNCLWYTSNSIASANVMWIQSSGQDWTRMTGTFTTGSGYGSSTTLYIWFTVENQDGSEAFYIDELVISSSQIHGFKSFSGTKTVVSSSFNLGLEDARKNHYMLVTNHGYGNNHTGLIPVRITGSGKNAVMTESAVLSSGTANEVFIGSNYIWQKGADTSTILLNLYDNGLVDGAIHPTSSTEIDVNYKYSQYLDGRLFVANVTIDPDSEAEEYGNWIVYSEMLQPDILPITNYLQVKDLQGGEITGLSTILGDLIVFMERGIYRLRIPSESPSGWSLIEAEENIGCIAPNSLTKVKDTIFFAGNDNMYALNPNFELTTVTETIRDDYQASANLNKTLTIYDVKKQRLLCRFGDTGSKVYSLDLDTDREAWNIITPGTDFDGIVSFGIDENLKVYTTRQNSGTEIIELNPATKGAESISCTRLSGEIPTSTLTGRNMIRRFSAKYESNDNTTYKIYADGDLENPAWTGVFYNRLGNWDEVEQSWETILAPWTEKRNKSLASRVGRRARFFQVGIETETSNNIGLEIEKLEVELD